MSRDFKSGDVIKPWPDITMRTGSLNHPGGCIGYRVEFGGRAVALICDTEHVDGELDPNVLALIEKADLVIYDATYTEEEMENRRGFGHSTWQEGIKLCKAAGAKRLALFHHDPFRTDAELAQIEAEARQAFPGAFAARDGQSVNFAVKQKAKRALAECSTHAPSRSGRRSSRQSANPVPRGRARTSASRKAHAASSCTR